MARAAGAFAIWRRSAGRCRSSIPRSPPRSPRSARIAVRRRPPARLREPAAAYATRLPGPLYCDTSALLKLYLPEPGSDEFNRVVEGRVDVFVSDLAVTEATSALSRRLRQGELTGDVARRVQHAIVGRLDEGGYRRVELTREVHRRAEHFLLSLTETPLRTADALHLALATSAPAASLASFDVRLAAAARAVGLATYPA
ncbi:MAG TPA: type II toxin-antitoxin system VapC family toxin [Methylomirabilota bacterium]|nr:type II toxin-antitoxin system VapC family toxin [Methylomirabilota bacterium]